MAQEALESPFANHPQYTIGRQVRDILQPWQERISELNHRRKELLALTPGEHIRIYLERQIDRRRPDSELYHEEMLKKPRIVQIADSVTGEFRIVERSRRYPLVDRLTNLLFPL